MKNKKLIFGMCAFFACGFVNAQSITIDTNDFQQTIDMIGGDMERSASAVQTTVQNTDDVIRWGFEDINYNYCRIQFDKNQELVEGTKQFNIYNNQVLTMQRIKAINPDIKFYATMRSDYDGFGDENNMPDWIVDYDTRAVDTEKYAIFLADYLEYMDDNGVTIHTLATAKEWGAFINATVSRDIILKLQEECEDRGIPMPEINDPGSWSMAQGLNFMNQVEDLGTEDLYSAFSSHEYASNDTPEQEWPALVAKAQSLGKKIYQDETITGASFDGVAPPIFRYAQRAVLYQSGVSGEIMFEIWSRGLNNEIRSIYWPNGGVATRLNGHYVAKHFVNNVLGSQYITSTTQNTLGGLFSDSLYTGVTQMAFRKDNQIILWVMNFSHDSQPQNSNSYPSFTIDVEDSVIDGNIQHKYWNTGSNIEGTDAIITAESNTSFQTELQENSINVYIFNVQDTDFTPNPNKKYHIDNVGHNVRVSATGSSEEAFTQATSFDGVHTQWKFVPTGNGYWHIDRAAGGNLPRLRTDATASADMQATTSSGIYTYYDITESSSTPGSYFFTLPNGPANFNRLNVNNDQDVGFTDDRFTGGGVSFSITEVSTVVHIKKRNAIGFALDGGGANPINGQNVYLWAENENNVNQQWLEIDRGDGYYSYQKQGTNYCIDGNGGGADRQNVYLWQCATNNQNQHWKKVSTDSGFFQLVKRNSPGFALDGGSGGANAQNVQLFNSSNTSYNLQWRIEVID